MDEFEKNIKNTNFGTTKFLNISINLDSIINKESTLLINEYNNLTLNQIEFLYNKYIENLDKIFSFGNIKSKINSEIDNAFKSKLFPILKKVGIYNSGDEGVSYYDLPENIINDIDNSITQQISTIKEIMKKTEGINFIITNISPPDFSPGKNNIYDSIKESFNRFSASYISKENKEFEKIIGDNVINNFKALINDFIPSFGVDFFDRLLNFNKIQKIKRLYFNHKYSFAQSIFYYIYLSLIYDEISLPIDIQLKIFNFNNLDNIVKSKNDFILSNLNSKLDGYFEKTKNFIIEKYLNDMIKNPELTLKFTDNARK